MPWCGHEQADEFTIAGNMLAGPDVVAAMARAFRASDGERRDLSERLLMALEAGQAAGGDKRGKQSAALLVAAIREPRMYHNLRVDDHADPVAELRRVWAVVVAHTKQIESEFGSVRRFEHSARAKRINDRIDHVEQQVYDAVRSNVAPSTPRVWWNKFLEGWAGAVLAKIAVLVFIIIFIQKRPQGIFAIKGRSAEA